MNLYLLDQAQGLGQGQGWIMIVAMFAIFYFFMIRPQMKKVKEQKKFREGIKAGDKVVTAGGIHGEVDQVSDTEVIMKIESGAKMRVDKSAVSNTYTPQR